MISALKKGILVSAGLLAVVGSSLYAGGWAKATYSGTYSGYGPAIPAGATVHQQAAAYGFNSAVVNSGPLGYYTMAEYQSIDLTGTYGGGTPYLYESVYTSETAGGYSVVSFSW